MLPPIPSSPDYSLLIIIPLVEYRLHANGHLLSTVITVRNYEQWPCTVKCYARTFVSPLENDFYPSPLFSIIRVPSREKRCVRTCIRLVSVESPRCTQGCMVVYNNLLRVSFNISLWINLLLLLHFFTLVRLPTFPNEDLWNVEGEVFFELYCELYFSGSLLNWLKAAI